jgi:hypothetical protein
MMLRSKANHELLGKRLRFRDVVFTVTAVEPEAEGLVHLRDGWDTLFKLTAKQVWDGLRRGVLKEDA